MSATFKTTRKKQSAPNFPGQKLYKPDAVHVSEHELAHVDAAAIACIALGVNEATYSQIIAHTDCKQGGGEAAFEFPEKSSDKHIKGAAFLGAFGPIGNLDVDDIIDHARASSFEELYDLAGLSDADKALAARYTGAPLIPLTVVLAVAHVRAKLGTGKMQVRSKALRDVTNQNVDALMLHEIIPYSEAKAAYDAARERVQALLAR